MSNYDRYKNLANKHKQDIIAHIDEHGVPESFTHPFNDMGGAHNTKLHYNDRTTTINTQSHGTNVFTMIHAKK